MSDVLFPLNRLMPIPVLVRAELGRVRMPIKDVLAITQGSVLEFAELAGEPLSIYANEVLIAKGEVVVINDRFGVRVTEVLAAEQPCPPAE